MQTFRAIISKAVWRVSLTGMALLAAALAAPLAFSLAGLSVPAAQAQERRSVKVGLNKSMVMHLPGGVKDILVGDPKVAEVVLRSRRTMYLFARKLGQTNVYFLDAGGNPVLALDIEVVRDPRPLQKILRRMLPNANISVEMLQEQVVLSGTVKTPAQAQKAMQIAESFMKMRESEKQAKELKVISALKVAGKDQVMIKVKLAEVQRDVFKQLRTNFSQISFSSGDFSGLVGLAFPFTLGNNLASASTALTYGGRKLSGTMLLEALERDGLMRLLAEPTLTAVSGEAAKFMAGGEVPTVSGYDPTTRTYTYEWKPFGVLLGFTPLVLDEGRISLKVNIEVSELSNKYALPIGDVAVPGFEKRQTATTVELPSGGTLAIAGMIREQTKQNIDGVPGLKNLPILGALFRSRDFQSNQSELVVMATPYIVNPVNEKKLRTPLDRLNMSSDYQAYFLGRLHRVYGAPVKARANGLNYHGNIGFILD